MNQQVLKAIAKILVETAELRKVITYGEVSRLLVNSVKNNGPECLVPAINHY